MSDLCSNCRNAWKTFEGLCSNCATGHSDPGASEHHRRNRIIGRLGDHKILAALERIVAEYNRPLVDAIKDADEFEAMMAGIRSMLEDAARD